MGWTRSIQSEMRNALVFRRRGWEDNTETNLKETGYDVVYWMQVAQDGIEWWTLMETLVNLWVPQKDDNFLTDLATASLFRTGSAIKCYSAGARSTTVLTSLESSAERRNKCGGGGGVRWAATVLRFVT
jgi:hypothetical protein